MKVILIVAFLAVCAAASYIPKEYEKPREASYQVQWSVQDDESGVDISQREDRDRTVTRGEYQVDLPDGTRQIVTYVVDGDKGYVAQVKSVDAEPAKPDKRY